MARRWERLMLVGLAGTFLVGNASLASAQEPAVLQRFGTEAAAITVDALVLDRDGQPVQGLTKDDFVILEDGRPQTIVGFKQHEVVLEAPRGKGDEATPPPVAVLPEVATNELSDEHRGRVLALVIDDLGITPQTMARLKPTLTDWIRRRADPRDEITIMTTGGDLWWSDTLARGKDDLLAVLTRLEGKKLAAIQRTGDLSTWEAQQISVVHAAGELPPYSLSSSLIPQFEGRTVLDRVLQRYFDQRQCVCPPGSQRETPPCFSGVRACLSRAQMAAQEGHSRWALRAQAVLATLSNLSRSLASLTGRKSILLVSEEFLQDDSLGSSVREAVAALHRGNTAVYFLGALGLTAGSTFSAEQEYKPRAQDLASIGTEQTTLATAGAVALADATGGIAITSSNDLAAGLERMARDASSYYLLGYQPEKLPDGKWHKLEVTVSRPGVKVRARTRYLAERPEDLARLEERERRAAKPKDKDEKLGKRALAPSILTGSARGSLPLRLGAYVQDTNHVGQARILIVVEIDNSRVQVDRTATPWRATLDLTILIAGLSRAPTVPVDEQLKLSLGDSDVGNGWWLVRREIWLPPGVCQIRVFARDAISKAEGVVTERLVVPDVDQPYLSTPVITDRTLPPPKPGEPPRLVPTAQRRFGRGRPLLCQYEVLAFGGRTLEGVPQLVASYSLRRAEGQVVSSDTPTPIETDGFHAVRRITLPAEQLAEGAYVLEVKVDDRLAQRSLTASAPFVIEDGETARLPEPQANP